MANDESNPRKRRLSRLRRRGSSGAQPASLLRHDRNRRALPLARDCGAAVRPPRAPARARGANVDSNTTATRDGAAIVDRPAASDD